MSKNFLISEVLEDIRGFLNEHDGEYNISANDYGFKVAWLEDAEVYWEYEDPSNRNPKMGELTELCALLESLEATEEEITRNTND